MANQFLNEQVYANAFLKLLKNQLTMGRLVDTQFRDQVTDQNGLRIDVKRPQRFIANSNAGLQAQDLVTGSTFVNVNQYKNVHVSVGDLEYVQSYNELMQNDVLKSAASELAHDVDRFLLGKFKDFFSWVGTPGNNIGSPAQFNKAHTRLMNQSVPNESLSGVVSFDDGEEIRGSLIGGDIQGTNREALERTRIPILSEVNLYASNNLVSVTTGDREAEGAVAGGGQEVNYRDVKDNVLLTQELDLDGLGANATISKGEVFTIADVFAINPRSRETLSYEQQFTVVEDATADGSGAATVTITPAIIVAGTNDGTDTTTNTRYATVSAAPANDATVTWLGAAETTYPLRAAFHRNAISMVSARLQAPFTGVHSFAQDPETGISIRYWRGSDISTGAHIHRWDMIYGAETMDPFLGTRISGAGST
jgi:hypothetical protein